MPTYPIFVPDVLDVEASGFGSASYPIEVGVVTADGSRYCRLIKPFQDWQFWDKEAETLHGITRDALFENGRLGKEVCQELNRLYTNRTLYSDAWVVDYPWVRELFGHAQIDMQFRISAIEMLLNETQLAHWDETKAQVTHTLKLPRHRASNDAEIIQKTYLAIVANE